MKKTSLELRFVEWTTFFKSASSFREKLLKGLSFEFEEQEFYLIPIGQSDIKDSKLITTLATWRKRNQDTFPTRFSVTEKGTSDWLENAVVDNENRILFKIIGDSLKFIGHIGLMYKSMEDEIELDNVLRGDDEFPGLMSMALQTLEEWVEQELSTNRITLRVLASNTRAISFYLKNEYVEIKRISMEWEGSETEKQLVPGTRGDDFIISMDKDLLNTPAKQRVLTAGPSISSKEVFYIDTAVRFEWNHKNSDSLINFERKFADYLGVEYAMATSSCTGALHLALNAVGLGPGDEVLVPDITWVATASAVMYTGATPIFVDVDPKDWTMDVDDLERKITPKTKGIIPVHLYGFPAKLDEICQIAEKYGLIVIEDAAPAIGAEVGNNKVGTFGSFGCFSFQGAKLLVTGEGGMLVTNDSKLYEKARKDQDHGRRPGTFWIESLGHKYKMNNLTAAFGIGQLERVENQIERKRRIFDWYRENLSDLNCLSFQQPRPGSTSIHWMTSILVGQNSPVSREVLVAHLNKEGIDTRPVFPSISEYPIWGYKPEAPKVSQYIAKNGINLPSGVLLNRATIDRICNTIRQSLGV